MRVEYLQVHVHDSRVYLTRGGHAPVGPVVGLPAAGEVDVEDEVGGVARGVGLPVAALDTWTRGISDTWQDWYLGHVVHAPLLTCVTYTGHL